MLNKIFGNSLSKTLFVSLVCAVSQVSFAQTSAGRTSHKKKKTAQSTVEPGQAPQNMLNPGDGPLHFETSSDPPNTDHHEPIQFQVWDEEAPGPTYKDNVVEEDQYKAFIGFPRQRVGIYALPMSMASSWSYNGTNYNLTSTPLAIGVTYAFEFSPVWKASLEFEHSYFDVGSTSVASYTLAASTATLNNYYAKVQRCSLAKNRTERQLCVGLNFGNTSYPVFNFNSAENLAAYNLQDLVAGLFLIYQEPLRQSFFLISKAFYNYGLGIGNSGYTTTNQDSSFGLSVGVDWIATQEDSFHFGLEGSELLVKVNGLFGTAAANWSSNSQIYGLNIGYVRSF